MTMLHLSLFAGVEALYQFGVELAVLLSNMGSLVRVDALVDNSLLEGLDSSLGLVSLSVVLLEVIYQVEVVRVHSLEILVEPPRVEVLVHEEFASFLPVSLEINLLGVIPVLSILLDLGVEHLQLVSIVHSVELHGLSGCYVLAVHVVLPLSHCRVLIVVLEHDVGPDEVRVEMSYFLHKLLEVVGWSPDLHCTVRVHKLVV